MQAYTTAWRGSGTVEGAPPQHVEDTLRAETVERSLPGPSVSETLVAESFDGRLVKAYPLVFPAYCGDLRQPRLRTDLLPLEWTHHCFDMLTGVLSPLCVVNVLLGVFKHCIVAAVTSNRVFDAYTSRL